MNNRKNGSITGSSLHRDGICSSTGVNLYREGIGKLYSTQRRSLDGRNRAQLSPRLQRNTSVGTIYLTKQRQGCWEDRVSGNFISCGRRDKIVVEPLLSECKERTQWRQCQQVLKRKLNYEDREINVNGGGHRKTLIQVMVDGENKMGNNRGKQIGEKIQITAKIAQIVRNYNSKDQQLGEKLNKLEKNKQNKQNKQNKVRNVEYNGIKQMQKFTKKGLNCMTLNCNLDKNLMQQILLEQQLRAIKFFINEDNKQNIHNRIKVLNENIVLKELQVTCEEYDPLGVQLFGKLQTKAWDKEIIADEFIKRYNKCNNHWNQHFTQSKIKQYAILKQQSTMAVRNLKQFIRWLSFRFKLSLKSRDVFRVYNRILQSNLFKTIPSQNISRQKIR